MPRLRFACALLLCGTLAGLPAAAQLAPADSQAALARQLESEIAVFRQTPPGTAELDDVMDRIDQLVDRIDPRRLGSASLHNLITLLDLPGHPEVGQLALTLQHFGTRARLEAGPRLLALLPLYDCEHKDLSTGEVLRASLRRMGVQPPRRHCR